METYTRSDKRKRIDESDFEDEEKSNESCIEIMEDQLSCGICFEVFIEPVVLECGHDFCKFCIEDWCKKNDECPNCRAKIGNITSSISLTKFINNAYEASSDEIKEYREALVKDRERKMTAAGPGQCGALALGKKPQSIVKKDLGSPPLSTTAVRFPAQSNFTVDFGSPRSSIATVQLPAQSHLMGGFRTPSLSTTQSKRKPQKFYRKLSIQGRPQWVRSALVRKQPITSSSGSAPTYPSPSYFPTSTSGFATSVAHTPPFLCGNSSAPTCFSTSGLGTASTSFCFGNSSAPTAFSTSGMGTATTPFFFGNSSAPTGFSTSVMGTATTPFFFGNRTAIPSLLGNASSPTGFSTSGMGTAYTGFPLSGMGTAQTGFNFNWNGLP